MLKTTKKDKLLGTLDMLVLRVVSTGPLHGYAIARRIEEISDDVLNVQQGSLYPALHRLEKKAFVKSQWQTLEKNKQLKVYKLTKAGKACLKDEIRYWQVVSAAVNTVLKNA